MSLLPVEQDCISLKRPNSERGAEDRVDIMISEEELDGIDMGTKVLRLPGAWGKRMNTR